MVLYFPQLNLRTREQGLSVLSSTAEIHNWGHLWVCFGKRLTTKAHQLSHCSPCHPSASGAWVCPATLLKGISNYSWEYNLGLNFSYPGLDQNVQVYCIPDVALAPYPFLVLKGTSNPQRGLRTPAFELLWNTAVWFFLIDCSFWQLPRRIKQTSIGYPPWALD